VYGREQLLDLHIGYVSVIPGVFHYDQLWLNYKPKFTVWSFEKIMQHMCLDAIQDDPQIGEYTSHDMDICLKRSFSITNHRCSYPNYHEVEYHCQNIAYKMACPVWLLYQWMAVQTEKTLSRFIYFIQGHYILTSSPLSVEFAISSTF
jgi:hypothetical protein